MFEAGDFKFGGSVVYKGITVAASGLKWEHDLAVSGSVAAICHALTIGSFGSILADDTKLFI